MDDAAFDLLVQRHLDGGLDADGRAAFAAALAEPRWQARLRDLADLEGMLVEECRAGATRRRRRWLPWAAAAAALLIGAAGLAWMDRGEMGRVLAVDGDATADGRPLAVGSVLHVGQRIALAEGATLRWRRDRESTLDLAPGSRLRFAEDALELDHGSLLIDAAPGSRRPPAVRTPHARASVTGTIFAVSVDAARTRIDVHRGSVRLSAGAQTVEVPAGGSVEAAGGEPRLLPPAGLRADFFLGDDFRRFAGSRRDAVLAADWTGTQPLPAIGRDHWCARWTGLVVPRYSETYAVTVQVDDGARLWIDDALVIDDWKVQGANSSTGTVALTAGRAYRLRLEYFQHSRESLVSLRWSSPSQRSEIVPAECLRAQ